MKKFNLFVSSLYAMAMVSTLFTILKLMNVIHWSWIVVLIPVWIIVGMILLALVIALVLLFLITMNNMH